MTSNMKCRTTVRTTGLREQEARSPSWARGLPPTSLLLALHLVLFTRGPGSWGLTYHPTPNHKARVRGGWMKKETLGPANQHAQLPTPAAMKEGEDS